MTPISPEDPDFDNVELERRSYRRRSEDNEMFSMFSSQTLPSWANTLLAVAKAIGFIGVPSVIALYLVYLLSNQTSTWLPKIEAQEVQTSDGIAEVKTGIDKQVVKQDQIHRLLQRICSNTAKTSEDRQHCFDD